MSVAALDLSDNLRGAPSLSPKQLASVRQSRARINLWTGAIRSGKTIASLLRWLLYVRNAPTRGQLVMIGRTRDSIARNLFAELQNPEIFGAMADEIHYTPGSPVAYIFGRKIHIIGAHDAKAEKALRGLTCAGAYVDEATLIPKEFWTQLLGRMSVAGAKLFATTNPDSPAHYLRKDFLLRARQLGLRHWHFVMDDNPILTEAYKRQARLEFVGLWFRRFVLGHWVSAEGAIYDMWDEERHVVKALPLIDRWISAGVDYGTGAPFAALAIGLGVDRNLYAVSEYRYDSKQAHRSKTDAEYVEAMSGWLDGIEIPGTFYRDEATGLAIPRRGISPEYICVDPSAKSYIEALHRAQYNPTKARNSVLDGIRTVAALLAHFRLFVHESCEGLIAEIPGYSWDDEKQLKKGIDEPIKADDHSCDALRYGIYTPEQSWRPYIEYGLAA